MMSDNFQAIQPEGILDSVRANNLRRDIINLIEDGNKLILLDLHEISFMNSSGMGILVATLKAVKAKGGELVLCSLSEQVKIIFELSRMDRIFQVYSDLQEFVNRHSVTTK
jgi:anti-anti-sigma factor